MTVTAKGRMNVAAPGTPVQLSTNPAERACKIFFQVIPGLTSKAYIGKSGLNRSSLDGVMRILWPNPSGGISDSFSIEAQDGADSLNLAEYYFDMDVAGEGLLVSYWTE